jgi:NADPH:quinone reductase
VTTMMLAGVASETGLVMREIPRPVAEAGQILVKVIAAGLNRADLNAAKGAGVASKSALGRPIGMEWSGTVEAVGGDVMGIAVGDVVACSGTGGYAEYAVADAGRVLFVRTADPVATAGLPLALMTAHNALVTEGRFARGQTVLVHGATSGVGIAALKVARLLQAAKVIGTSTTAEKCARLIGLGADVAIDSSAANWSQQVLDATGGNGADVVVDMVTGSSINETMLATALHGHIVNVGRLGGTSADLNLDLHALRRLNFVGVTFRSRSIEQVRDIVARVRQDLWRYVENGALALPVDRSFALAAAPDAHAYMAANRHFGKILLRP